MRNFKQLLIWQKGLEIATQSFKLVKAFPLEERFGLSSQMTKAAISIPSNIAEGSSRKSEKEYGRFLEISLGSSFELETQAMIADAINYGQKDLIKIFLNDIREEQRMISGFISQLNL
jgi:four helix bundle protein